MTRQSTFKKRIRARMQKTGERYATARQVLLDAARQPLPASAPEPYPDEAPVLTDLGPLRAALTHAGVVDPATGAPFSEARLFGLSGGPGFMAFVFQYAGSPPMLTFTCRSFSLPGPVVERALQHAGIVVDAVQTGSARRAADALAASLEGGRVAHVAVDQAQLPWMAMDPAWRGQWPRHVNVVGQQPDGTYLVQDQALWTLAADALVSARAGVRKAKHRQLTVSDSSQVADPVAATQAALAFTAQNQRQAPWAQYANNFGLAGLLRLCERMRSHRKEGWQKVFATGPYAFRALWRTWECLHVELTAPAGGRPLYARFLDEAASLPGLDGLGEVAERVVASGEAFEAWADTAAEAGGALMEEAIQLSDDLDEALRSGDSDAPEQVGQIRAERRALPGRCDLDEAGRKAAFDALGACVERVHACELAWVDALEGWLSARS